MTEEVESILNSDVRMAIGQCKPEELFTERQLIRWARTRYPEDVFSSWELEQWAEDNDYVNQDDVADEEQVVKNNGSPSELADFVKRLDREMSNWEFTKKVRDWAVAEMEKHEVLS